MQNNKWNHTEEKDLVFKLRGGSQMKDIAVSSGRSYGAIKERLKKIIYENIKNVDNQQEVQKIGGYLNLDTNLIKKYYHNYKNRLEQENNKVNGETNNKVNGETNNKVNGETNGEINRETNNKTNNKVNGEINGEVNGETNNKTNNKVNGEINREINREINKVNGEENNPNPQKIEQNGGTNMTIKKQNEVLEEIIKNYELKKKVGKLVKTKQLDKNSKEALKKLLLNIKN
jgi:hypothetical protein